MEKQEETKKEHDVPTAHREIETTREAGEYVLPVKQPETAQKEGE